MTIGFDAQLARRLATAEGEIARLQEELTAARAERDGYKKCVDERCGYGCPDPDAESSSKETNDGK